MRQTRRPIGTTFSCGGLSRRRSASQLPQRPRCLCSAGQSMAHRKSISSPLQGDFSLRGRGKEAAHSARHANLPTTLFDDLHVRSARDLGNEAGSCVLSAQSRHRTNRRQDQRRSVVPSQRGGRDAEETQLCGKNRLFLELVIPNPIVAGDHDPPLCSRLREPHDVLSGLRKELVVHTYVEPSGAKGLWHLLTPERAIDEEYEGLRRLSPAGARSGPLPRC